MKAFRNSPGVELVNVRRLNLLQLAPGDHLGRFIIWTEIQSVVRPANAKVQKRPWTQHKNPLTNKQVLFRLNPYAKTIRRHELRTLNFFRTIA